MLQGHTTLINTPSTKLYVRFPVIFSPLTEDIVAFSGECRGSFEIKFTVVHSHFVRDEGRGSEGEGG